MRTLGRIILLLLILVVGVVGYFVLTFDPEAYKPQIAAAVKQATGRELAIKGKIALALSLTPTIEVTDATLSNPPGYSGPYMASIEKLDMRMALMPLIGRRVEIDRLILTNPHVTLETDVKGRPNWILTPPAGPAPAPVPPGATQVPHPATAAPPPIAVKEIRIAGGVFTYRDGRSGETNTLSAKQISVEAESSEAPLHINVVAALNGTGISVDGTTGGWGHLVGSIRGEWPVKLAVTVGEAKFALDGSIADPMAARGLDVGLTAEVPDLGALGALMKQPLPPLKSLAVTARLSGDPGHIALNDLKLTSASGDIAGKVSLMAGLPSAVTAVLTSNRLDLDALAIPVRPTPAAAPTAPAPAPPSAPAEAPQPKWLIPDTPLPVGDLQLMNADLHLSIGTLHAGGADYKSLQAHAVVKDGVLTLSPAAADLPQGHVALTLTADVGKTEPPVHLTLHAPAVALGPLLAALNAPPYVTGNLEVAADLRGAGISLHAIAASLDGVLTLIVPGGTIDLRRLGGSAAGLLQSLKLGKAASGAGALRCLVIRMDFAHGIGTVRPMVLGASLINVDGGGTVNLADETLALTLQSRATLAGAAVTVPVNVFGSIAAPQTKVNEIGIAGANAAALGGLIGGPMGGALGGGQRPVAGDSCPAALAMARGQAAPGPVVAPAPAPGPAQAPAKPPNAGQLLKQLFH